MALPRLFGAKKAQLQKFLALDIGEEAITAGLFVVDDGKIKILKTSSAIEWKDENLTDAAEAADVALEELGKEADKVEQVVLGLQESWVNQRAIAQNRKGMLKTLNEQLSLKPLGFVVSSEALVQYLKELEGGPITCVLVQYTSASLYVSVVKAGKLEHSEAVGRSGNTTNDLTEAFTRIGAKALPSRMILYSTRMKHEELESEKQALMAHDWSAAGFFLHVPKIEALPQNIVISGVCISGGYEVAASLGLVQRSSTPTETMAVGEMGEADAVEPVAAVTASKKAVEEETPTAPKTEESDFGFTDVGADAAVVASAVAAPTAKVKAAEAAASALHATDSALAKEAVQAETTTLSKQDFIIHENLKQVEESAPPTKAEDTVEPKLDRPRFNPIASVATGLRKTFNSLLAGRSLTAKFHTDETGGKRLRVILIGAAVVICAVVAGGVFYLQSSMTAIVEVTLKTLPLAKDVTISIDPTIASTDTTSKTLKVTAVQKEVSGQKSADTTGTATIGDKAKGKVTVFNATSSTKTFPAGTVLNGPNSLKFTTDTQIDVASSSGSASSITPGKTDVAVTASAIGTDSNLPAKTEFTVANFDKISYVASNTDPFTGGSKREIQAVSKSDIDGVTASLQAELKDQAQSQLQTETQGGAQVLPAISVSVKSSSADAKVGDQVKTVTVSMTVVASAYTYSQGDLTPLANALLQDGIPAGATLLDDKTRIAVRQLTPPASDSALPSVSATLNAEASPATDKSAIAQSVAGKTIDQAVSLLRQRSEVASVVIRVAPAIARALFGKMPGNVSHIQVETKM